MLMHYVKIDPTSSAMVSETNHCYAIDLICHMDTIPTEDWIYSRKMVSRSVNHYSTNRKGFYLYLLYASWFYGPVKYTELYLQYSICDYIPAVHCFRFLLMKILALNSPRYSRDILANYINLLIWSFLFISLCF